MLNVVNSEMAGAVRAAPQRERTVRKKSTEWLLLLSLPLLFLVAWGLSALVPPPDSKFDYYLGITGALLMLAMFLYPVRKQARFMHSWGPVKYWFISHMVLGIGAPLIILVHSRFQIGSLNAGVALISMLIVMLSGVIGRFIYARIHHGMYGQRATLAELQGFLRLNSAEVHSKLVFAPDVERALLAFEAFALAPHKGFIGSTWSLMTLWVHGRVVYRRCKRSLALALAKLSRRRGWQAEERRRYRRAVTNQVRAYIENLQRAAHFSIYERMFSLWHVLHVPLVYMLVASTIAHVVAVHMY